MKLLTRLRKQGTSPKEEKEVEDAGLSRATRCLNYDMNCRERRVEYDRWKQMLHVLVFLFQPFYSYVLMFGIGNESPPLAQAIIFTAYGTPPGPPPPATCVGPLKSGFVSQVCMNSSYANGTECCSGRCKTIFCDVTPPTPGPTSDMITRFPGSLRMYTLVAYMSIIALKTVFQFVRNGRINKLTFSCNTLLLLFFTWTMLQSVVIFFFYFEPISLWLLITSHAFFLSGILVEVIAEVQLMAFKRSKRVLGYHFTGKPKLYVHGPWAWSRHPDLLGRMLYCSIGLVSLTGVWYACLSSAFAFFLFCCISIPNIETNMQAKYDTEWLKYAHRVPIFVPWPSLCGGRALKDEKMEADDKKDDKVGYSQETTFWPDLYSYKKHFRWYDDGELVLPTTKEAYAQWWKEAFEKIHQP